MYGPITGLTRFYNHIQQALASSERVFNLLDTEPEVKEAPDAEELEQVRGEVVLRGVSFSYGDGPLVLSDIDVHARPGEMVAFVGPSGAGKTTLTNLLLRFYDPKAGQVLVDGKDVRTLKLSSLRSRIALVQQDPFLFNDSVEANIAYGRLDAGEADVVAAARAANAHEFIVDLPQQYDTVVGERGIKLSGGQRQRISIARAILADPRILILDEATSSVDTEMELLIQEAIDRVAENRTTFVIAHRLSTVRHADQIIVLDEGRIVESGTHDELISRNGLYQRLCAVQFQTGSPRQRVPAYSPQPVEVTDDLPELDLEL
jgi:subfamily B ATP-binding cassette protein MsbA